MRRGCSKFFGWYAVAVWALPGSRLVQRIVWPGWTRTPIGSNQTFEPSALPRMLISTVSAAAARRSGREPARSKPPPAQSRRLRESILLGRGHARLVGLRHMPEHDVVVRLLDPGVAGVEIHVDMVDLAARGGEIVELLLG